MKSLIGFFTRGGGGYVIGSALQRGSSIVVTLIFVAVADIGVFGRLEVFRTLTGLAAVVGVIGLDSALGEHIERDEAASQSTALRLQAVICSVGIAIGFVGVVGAVFGLAEWMRLSLLFIGAGLAQAAVLVALVICRIRRSVQGFVGVSVIFALSTAIPLLGMVGAPKGQIVERFGIAWWIGTVAAAIGALAWIRGRFDLGEAPSRAMARRLILTGLPVAPLGLLSWIIQSNDRFVLYASRGADETGWYSLANRLLAVISLLLFPIQATWWPAAVRARRLGAPLAEVEIASAFATGTAGLCLTAQAPMVLLLDNPRLGAGVVILMLATFVNFLYFFPVVPVLEQGRTVMCTQAFLAGAIVNFVLTIVLAPRLGFFGASVSTVFGYLAVVAFLTRGVRRLDSSSYPVLAPATVATALLVSSGLSEEPTMAVRLGLAVALAATGFALARRSLQTMRPATGDLRMVLSGNDA